VKLRDWLLKNNMTAAQMSRALGQHKNTLGLALRGKNGFSEELVKKIYDFTGGEVEPNDIYLNKWKGEEGGDGGEDEGLTPDPDAVPVGGRRGSMHRGAISGALYGLAREVEAHGL